MDHNKEKELDWLHAQSEEGKSAANTVQANEAMDDAFYGNEEQKVRDIVDVSEVNRNQS
ncbi:MULTISPECIES: hypothetical protein [unclassified Paenibacillus]|uniref:hypothetical protein n=1 Tax=unclassified Paenibacillus TaxID=185978 RepID=UPI001AEA13A4|nr:MULTISPECIES: hypothetical protein [unclassified Paenibacillus]MBP1154305.1 hypothetical protein [Paenibacillus sp. PvP091]MBP1170311.1 hypothetical protein [Paenibacillus sp. PvR098]MBP2441339.1 hypothetical protein [Paenibacillus sp. PvP052]